MTAANTYATARTNPVTRELKPEPAVKLTSMGHECLKLASKGFTASQTGEYLGISKKTVEYHLGLCRVALDASATIEACCIAVRKGLIP